ncbi:hypothetical protein D9M70_578540 [compost metagenome]
MSNTSSGQLAPALAGVDSLLLGGRQGRPYAPGQFRINGQSYPAAINGAVAVDFVHRDRVMQADQLIDTTQGSIGPEAGTTYTLKIYSGTTLKRTYIGVSAGWIYPDADAVADGTIQALRVTLGSVRGGLDSWQVHDHTTERYGLGFHLGDSLGGTVPA